MTDDDRPEGIFRAILRLLEEMDARDGRTRGGRWADGRTSVDYSFSIGSLDETLGMGSPDEPEAHILTTRETDDGILIAADLPRVRPEDVSVDLDRDVRTVTITVDNHVVGRFPLDDGDWTVTDVSFNNEVMEVKVAHE